jgi:DNA-binding transcriptional regulator YiaG
VALLKAIRQVALGQADNLGGGVFKKRLNDNMHRSIVLTKAGEFWIFAYLFAKKIGRTSRRTSFWRSASSPNSTGARRKPILRRKSRAVPFWRSLMTTKRKFKSDAFEAIHSAVEGMYAAGTIDKETMRTFDEECLAVPQELTPDEIKALREKNHVSQPVFARYLNTSQSTVQKWETGAKRPSGPALKLLSLVHKHGLQVLS